MEASLNVIIPIIYFSDLHLKIDALWLAHQHIIHIIHMFC